MSLLRSLARTTSLRVECMDRGVVSHFSEMTYVLRHNHSKYPSTVLYRSKTVPTVLAVLRLLLETFTKTEVTAFFKC